MKWREFVAALCALLLVHGHAFTQAQQPTTAAAPTAAEGVKLPPDQLDALVAPIALYPDGMLAQVLVAATYPLEIIQLQQWLEKNKGLKDAALAEAVKKQDWDPSIQAMAGMPEVVNRLANDIKWTTDLGNAFLAQQSDVMDAVQRMRAKAKENGNLKTNDQQKVETKVVENKSVVVIEQANPQVVYVPSYNPVVVYGPPVYPYPPIYYPPPGYYAAGMAISFGVGVAMGAFWGGGGWGWGCGWGGNDIDIDIENSFNRNSNRNVNRDTNRTTNRSGSRTGASSNKWQHNPQHRGAAPYSDRATASKFGGTARGDSLSSRQASARRTQASQLGSRSQPGTMDRGAGSRASSSPRGGTGMSNMSRGSGDRVGNRQVSNRSSQGGGAFGGASSGMSGRSTRMSSERGSSSFGGSRGGSRGGGGRRR
jgi:hypothetical protein